MERNEGYVQGMSDLCAPIYVVTGADEIMTFWCFVSVMERMVSLLAICVWIDVLIMMSRNKTSSGIRVE
jgi:Rab-GTPase-TBC domain